MKRILCLLCLIALLLCGCGKDEKTTFYYKPVDLLSELNSPVISPETRNITGYSDNPQFLISLYLTGPLDKSMQSPFPEGTKLKSLQINNQQMIVELYDLPQNISDSDFSLACACLTMTCMEFSDLESVMILCGNRSVTMNRNILTLSDISSTVEASEGGIS